MSSVVIYTAENDENHLLGRPGQYVGKANWSDTRDPDSVDIYSVETFANSQDLGRRQAYLKTVTQSVAAFCEYNFTEGLVLLRISCHLTPAQAADYDNALAGRTTSATAPQAIPSPTAPITLPSPPASSPSPAANQPASVALSGTFKDTLPAGTQGQLAVIEFGGTIQDDGTVPVILRNNTGSAVENIEVDGSARDSAGALAGSGQSQGITPYSVGAGKVAFGYVYFSSDLVGRKLTFQFTASGSAPRAAPAQRDLPAKEVNKVAGGDIVGSTKNLTDIKLAFVGANIICFDSAQQPTFSKTGGFGNPDTLQPGQSTTFTISLYGKPCVSFLIGVTGNSAS
ncbi:MAG TPA: hypothetical protein VFT74_14865 [Isosphaeraceae bacterium]|nr:hypothetical protein [Isosphaeraceae bacterium]